MFETTFAAKPSLATNAPLDDRRAFNRLSNVVPDLHLDGHVMPVKEWTRAGFSFDLPAHGYRVGGVFRARLTLRIDRIERSVPIEATVRRLRNDTVGVSYRVIYPRDGS